MVSVVALRPPVAGWSARARVLLPVEMSGGTNVFDNEERRTTRLSAIDALCGRDDLAQRLRDLANEVETLLKAGQKLELIATPRWSKWNTSSLDSSKPEQPAVDLATSVPEPTVETPANAWTPEPDPLSWTPVLRR